jgi:hypothetical protein
LLKENKSLMKIIEDRKSSKKGEVVVKAIQHYLSLNISTIPKLSPPFLQRNSEQCEELKDETQLNADDEQSNLIDQPSQRQRNRGFLEYDKSNPLTGLWSNDDDALDSLLSTFNLSMVSYTNPDLPMGSHPPEEVLIDEEELNAIPPIHHQLTITPFNPLIKQQRTNLPENPDAIDDHIEIKAALEVDDNAQDDDWIANLPEKWQEMLEFIDECRVDVNDLMKSIEQEEDILAAKQKESPGTPKTILTVKKNRTSILRERMRQSEAIAQST